MHKNNSDGIDTKIICSSTFNPWFNLALEEYLLKKVSENQIILYLWQNKDTVVIGRNQNPWKECRYKELESDGGKLARRLSGGGAVFHDLGNLNFTFIANKKVYNQEKQLGTILKAVKNLGINAEFTGRNDITVNGKKFSGNAFYYEENSAYHHGTLLVNSDFDKLTQYLQVSKEKIVSKGIDSIRSRVVNLSSIQKAITVEKLQESLKKSFIEDYEGTLDEVQVNESTYELEDLYKKYSSWEWRYGDSPNFDIVLENRFIWGGIEIGLSLKKGYIVSSTIYSDAMNSDLIQKIALFLKGMPFQFETIVERMNSIEVDCEDSEIIKDIQKWLLKE